MPLPVEQNAYLSSLIYDPLVAGERINSNDREYYVRYVSPPSATNYRGAVVEDMDTGQLIVLNKGTDPLDIHDVHADLGMGLMGAPTQWPEAAATMRWALDYAHEYNIPLSNISATGHSLGGSLAQLQAAMFDVYAETFNAYGAASMARHLGMNVEAAQDWVVNHRMYHDPVSAIATPIGRTVEYMDYRDYQRHQHAVPSPLGELGAIAGAHGIANFWDKAHNRPAAVLVHNYLPDLQREQHRGLEQLPPGMPSDMSLGDLFRQAALQTNALPPLAANASVDQMFDHLCAAMDSGDDRLFRQVMSQVAQTDFVQDFQAQVVERMDMQDRQLALEAQLEQTQQQLIAQQSHAQSMGRSR